MSNDLQRLLADRAERAPLPQRADRASGIVAARAERRRRRRRNQLTVVSAAALVVAVTVIGVAVTSGGSAPRRGAVTAGGDPGSAPHPTARPATSSTPVARTSLTRVDAAPRAAETSLRLVPQGFGYISHDSANTYYGPRGTTDTGDFSKVLVVDVHATIGSTKDYTLTVNGKPASYGTSDGFTIVRIRYTRSVDVGFQAPASAPISKSQALRMAATLDVRSTKHRTHG